MPVIVDVADPGVVIVAVTGPLTCVHVPEPTVGALPAMVADPPVVQIVWSGPAFAVVGAETNVMITLSCDAVHGALAMVQRKVYAPATETVTFVVARLALTNVAVPGPATNVHVPVPVVGVLPASVVVKPHTEASGPAFDAVGGALTITCT
jgi:hypothetical protein